MTLHMLVSPLYIPSLWGPAVPGEVLTAEALFLPGGAKLCVSMREVDGGWQASHVQPREMGVGGGTEAGAS